MEKDRRYLDRGIEHSNKQLEGEAKEPLFEITEREKYLLQIVANVITRGYLPDLAGEHTDASRKTVEGVLRRTIDERTKVVPETPKTVPAKK